MIKFLKSFYYKYAFQDNLLAIFINPHFLVRREIIFALKNISNQVYGDVLDVGCGSMPYRRLFNCLKYIGMEVKISGHDHSTSTADIYYDGFNFPISPNSYDTVVCFEVLEHVVDIDKVLKEIKRVLKPESHVVITLPLIWPEHEMPFDFRRLTSYGIIAVMERNGFEVIYNRKIQSNLSIINSLITDFCFGLSLKRYYLIPILFPVILLNNLLGYFLFRKIISPELYYGNLVVAKIRN